MGKLLMKILYSILFFTAVTLCSARELYVTKNWNDAKIQELYYATDNTKTILHKTTVSFRHDGKNLIIRAVMDVKKDYPFPAITNRDGKWPSSENIEIFIDPGADGRGYYQIAVGANGDRFDNRYVKKAWQANWKSQVKHAPGQWIAEITIPYPAKSNFCSGFNFCRNVKTMANIIPPGQKWVRTSTVRANSANSISAAKQMWIKSSGKPNMLLPIN